LNLGFSSAIDIQQVTWCWEGAPSRLVETQPR